MDNTRCAHTTTVLGIRESNDIISYRNKEMLFASEKLGEEYSQQLLNMVIYIAELHFVLKVVVEHTRLKCTCCNSQICLKMDDSC